MKKIRNRKTINKHQLIKIIVASLVIFCLLLFVIYPKINQMYLDNQNKKPSHIEIGFVDTYQVLVFWKTEELTTGYVKVGNSPRNISQKVYPINKSPSYIHTVILDKIPIEGAYVTVHSDDAFYFWPPKSQKVEYEPN